MPSNNVANDDSIDMDTSHVFLSESSFGEQQTLRSTLRFLDNHNEERPLRVFSSRLSDLHDSEEFKSALQSLPSTANASAAVYTTKCKDDYINSRDFKRIKLTLEAQSTGSTADGQANSSGNERVQFIFNKKPSNRTNCAEVNEEHMLYVVCEHTSAATAYLHHIGNELVRNYAPPQTNEDRHLEQVTDHEQIGTEST
jgi:hypothetical protein